ncbi:MAG: MerR family transcriptional regulator [Acidimicrobiales bacterium]
MDGSLTIDEFARRAGTTGRQVRALQSRGLLSHPVLIGRTGFYDAGQLDRLQAILRLQREGFSLAGIAVLLRASDAGKTLEHVVGLRSGSYRAVGDAVGDEAGDEAGDDAEFWGWPDSPKGQLLAVLPTTLFDLSIAS